MSSDKGHQHAMWHHGFETIVNMTTCWFFGYFICYANALSNCVNIYLWYEHYYKMWVQFTSPRSLDQWIHSKSSEITWCIGAPFVVVGIS